MTLGLTNDLPTREQLTQLAAISDPEAQNAFLAAELDRLLADPIFYDTMIELGHTWMNIAPVAPIADVPEYGLIQARPIVQCPPGTLHEGKWGTPYCEPGRAVGDSCQPCNGTGANGLPTPIRRVEPWWAEGTTIEVIGYDGDESRTTENPAYPEGDPGRTLDCGVSTADEWQYEQLTRPMCGCGPHLAYCHPTEALQSHRVYQLAGETANRRLTWEEPARLLAHIAWHDRPLDDLIAGSYSVAPANLQHTYVRYARRLGMVELDQNDRWWRSSQWTSPADPHHEPTDPNAWSEFPIADRNPFLIADRNYHFDPRVEPAGSMRGIPAAGVLTMPGFLGGLTRERVRGARTLEMFACETFSPPDPTAVFAPYTNDPAAGGPCMTCHAQIDPASIHFKRFMRVTGSFYPVGRGYDMLGVGNSHVSPNWINDARLGEPFSVDPWDRMRRLWVPETRMTPVDAATGMTEPESRYIDFLPPDQTLYGATSDGTVGPLGLAKLLINTGVFDRCAVRRLHQRFVGRDVDPTIEAGYLGSLVEEFVSNGRRVRPFIRHLMQSRAFGRGL
jgi:hypothetical protein